MKAPSDEGSKATSNETIARGNRTYDYVSAKLTGGEKNEDLQYVSLPPALWATSLIRGRQGAPAPQQQIDKR